MKKVEEFPQNPFETHGYKQGQELLIPAEFVFGVLNFCESVKVSQPKVAALSSYPKNVREIINPDTKKLERVDIDWELHNSDSFFNTALSYKKDDYFVVTDLEMKALQIENALIYLHKKNIEEGVAVEIPKQEPVEEAPVKPLKRVRGGKGSK